MTPDEFAKQSAQALAKEVQERLAFQKRMQGCSCMEGYSCKATGGEICEEGNCPFIFHAKHWWLHEYRGPVE